MPLYTYACEQHGEFAAWGRMSESDAAQQCPTCQEPAPRALARPAVAGAGRGEDAMACGAGACAAEAPKPSGHVCCGGCVH